ncbi:MAG: hypothetical protein JW991_01345 [Candidatus Pacebacteria bacterium]|nr:hypothetical protein [Candidatus Paceibacterota bacterium]
MSDLVSESKIVFRPERIQDPEWEKNFQDVVALFKIRTSQGKTLYLATLGYTADNLPALPGQRIVRYQTLVLTDYRNLIAGEIDNFFFLPVAPDREVSRFLADSLHCLISSSIQLDNLSPEVIAIVRALLENIDIKSLTGAYRLIRVVREILYGRLKIQPSRTTKDEILAILIDLKKMIEFKQD